MTIDELEALNDRERAALADHLSLELLRTVPEFEWHYQRHYGVEWMVINAKAKRGRDPKSAVVVPMKRRGIRGQGQDLGDALVSNSGKALHPLEAVSGARTRDHFITESRPKALPSNMPFERSEFDPDIARRRAAGAM